MNAREDELIARALLADQSQIDVYFKEKRWRELAALVRFARQDVPVQLAQTDPALYRQLREQITLFFCVAAMFSPSSDWKHWPVEVFWLPFKKSVSAPAPLLLILPSCLSAVTFGEGGWLKPRLFPRSPF
jgi:hypothetical protein